MIDPKRNEAVPILEQPGTQMDDLLSSVGLQASCYQDVQISPICDQISLTVVYVRDVPGRAGDVSRYR